MIINRNESWKMGWQERWRRRILSKSIIASNSILELGYEFHAALVFDLLFIWIESIFVDMHTIQFDFHMWRDYPSSLCCARLKSRSIASNAVEFSPCILIMGIQCRPNRKTEKLRKMKNHSECGVISIENRDNKPIR